MTDREQFVFDNAPALVADLEAQVLRQRAELHKLNRRCAVLTAERDQLRRQVEGHAERIVAQSELLSKRAERSTAEVEVARLRAEVARLTGVVHTLTGRLREREVSGG